MYFSQIQFSSGLSLLFLTFSYLLKQNFLVYKNAHSQKHCSWRKKKVAWDHPQCTVVTFQCRIYSVLSEQTASCSHSRIHESKDYQSWRDPWGLITPVQPFILKMGEIRPKERKWRSAAKLALRPRVQTPKSGPARTEPLRKAEFMRVKWLAKGGGGKKGNARHRTKRPTLWTPPSSSAA